MLRGATEPVEEGASSCNGFCADADVETLYCRALLGGLPGW